MTLRIAMVGACPYPVPQGSQVFMRENALALRRLGHDVHLVVYGYGLGEEQDGLKVHRCRRIPGDTRTAAGPSWVKPILDIALWSALRRVIQSEQIDVVWANNYEGLLVALAAGKRPIIYHAHNAMSDELPYYFRHKKLPEKFGRWLDRTFPRRADCIITPHRRLAGHLIVRGCDHTRVKIVPPMVDAALFEPCSVTKDMPPVLYAGNLDSYQNLGLLFGAMMRIRKTHANAKLLIATADRAEFPEAELIHTPGFDSLQKVLARDAVFAVPRVSWSGYPIKLLNAMAAGQAIVACQSAAYPLTHGINGLIVPDNDIDAFSEAMMQLLLDHKLRAELGRHARETVLNEYQPGRVSEQLDQIVRELAGREGGSPG
ncbi:MAG TPA: glycosyltransferase family 4 protein [Candidatus Hydrogenedentes bacterium]|nr:glycosyltransferase family 4 protein [Candidatus Hydrogenedentota bacterium]